MITTQLRTLAVSLTALLVLAACGGSDSATGDAESEPTVAPTPAAATADDVAAPEASLESVDSVDSVDSVAAEPAGSTTSASTATSTFEIEVWADNWMAVYVDGVLIGEDSVPITTERSFNAETFTFEAATPFTVAIEAKDFKETDSGIAAGRTPPNGAQPRSRSKDGYDQISWDPSTQLIWGTDLEVDNSVVLRATVS